ncbi:TolC family protein [Marinobacterium sp. xm-a-152]|uniref:TolC family protein n=1 Tax=Marinobacterium sp. xm-a-152 TaxID=2497733 RepID=UPI0015692329|nr:TolC family protein [Marinobacterium sp. xm-a-152]NRP16103.1 Outer membrane efflux protein [Marinobacterium sp. xm-a-152]
MKTLKHIAVFAMCMSPTSVLANENDQALSLDSLLELTFKNPSYVLAKEKIASKKARLDIVESERLPSVFFEGNSDILNSSDDSRVITATAEHTLFDWGKLSSEIESSELQIETEKAKADDELLNIKLKVIGNFVTANSAKQKSDAVKDSIRIASNLRDIMARRVAQKVSPASDLMLAESRIGQLNTLQLQFTGQERDAQLALLQLTDRKASTLDTLQCNSDLNEAFIAELVVKRSPQLAAAKAYSRSLSSKFSSVDSKKFPAIIAGASYTQDLESGNEEARTYLTFRYNVDVGSRLNAEIAELKADYAAALADERYISQSLVRQAAALVNEYRINQSQIPVYKNLISIREEQLESHTRRFASGKSYWLDLMNAQQELSDARLAIIDTEAKACTAMLTLQQLTARNLNE